MMDKHTIPWPDFTSDSEPGITCDEIEELIKPTSWWNEPTSWNELTPWEQPRPVWLQVSEPTRIDDYGFVRLWRHVVIVVTVCAIVAILVWMGWFVS